MLILVLVPLLLLLMPWIALDPLFLKENENFSTVIVIDSVSELWSSLSLIVVLRVSLEAMPMPMHCGCGLIVVSVSYTSTVLFPLLSSIPIQRPILARKMMFSMTIGTNITRRERHDTIK
jgi:hypothetical protein